MKKFLVVLCVVCMVFSQVVFAAGSQYKHESESVSHRNNTMEQADIINIRCDDFYNIYGIVSNDDKEDWFEFRIDSLSGEGLFWFERPDGMDCDFYFYDENGKYITAAIGDIDELNNIYIRADKSYYLRVVYNSGIVLEPYEICFSIYQ